MGKLVDKLINQSLIGGIPTGYRKLDVMTDGLKPGSLIVLAGATGMGKSLLGLNILANVAKQGKRVVYYDLENGKLLSSGRMVKIFYGENESFFREENKKKLEIYLHQLEDVVDYYSHESLYDNPIIEFGLFKLLVYLIQGNEKADVFFIDPLQVLEGSIDPKDLYRDQGLIVQGLKELAQRTEKTIILCHHIRKSMTNSNWVEDFDGDNEVKYRLPTIEDLRGSGKIADFATDVWAMVRQASGKTSEERSKTLLRVLKNRTGLHGDVKLVFDENTLQFREPRVTRLEQIKTLGGGILGH